MFALTMAVFSITGEVVLHRSFSLGETHSLSRVLPVCLKSSCVSTDHIILCKAGILFIYSALGIKNLFNFYISFVVIDQFVCSLSFDFHHYYKWNVIFMLVTLANNASL